MDAVRFGRALGMGARGAAKAVAMAADAAASPSPKGGPAAAKAPSTTRTGVAAAQTVGRTVVQAKEQTRATQAGLARGGRKFAETAWGPFVRLSGVLWLELTGVFFGLFLLTAGISAWRLRTNLHDLGANHAEHERLLWSLAMVVVFGYFCLSSFVRAGRRERRGR